MTDPVWTLAGVGAAMSTCVEHVDEGGDMSPYCATHQAFMDGEGSRPVVWAILDALEPEVTKRF